MKLILAVVSASAAIASACSGNNGKRADISDTQMQSVEAGADLRGQWYIENIVFSDSDYVRPDETLSSLSQYIVFEDSTYFIQTNCNTFSGSYTVKGDSIILGDGMMTEMACDNMAVEDALRKILPDISSIDVQNDSVVRLNGASPAECILLRKATEAK